MEVMMLKTHQLGVVFIAMLACLPGLAQAVSPLIQADKALTIRMQAHMARTARKVAMPIGSLNADDDYRGFDTLAARLSSAQLVGLGESTHGTHEFNQFRFKLFKFLAQHDGFTHFLLEDMAFATAPLEDYVLGRGPDDSKATMTALMWPWCTEDMADFLRWVRGYNNSQPDEGRKVHVVGVDIQKPYRQLLHLMNLMRKTHQPENRVNALSRIADDMPKADAMDPAALIVQKYDPSTPGRWRKVHADLAAFEQNQSEPLPGELATLLRAIECGVENAVEPGGDSIRDRGMAMQILDVLKNIPPGSKAIWWAHNAHVSGGAPEHFPWAGTHLRAWLGNKYSVVGCFTMEGTLTAKDVRIMAKYKNSEGRIKPGIPVIEPGPMAFRFPDYFLEGILARGLDQGIVFADDMQRDPANRAFLSTRSLECSGVGDSFDPTLSPDDRMAFHFDAYDIWYFIKRSTAAANVRFPR